MKTLNIGLIVLAILVVLPFASAFGVSTPYWKENPLVMNPGEMKDVTLNLQNMVGDKDVAIRVSLMNGQEIATLTDSSNDYLVPIKTADTYVHIQIKIPQNVTLGSVYPVTLSFITITSGAGGAVSMGTGIEKSFDVIIQAPVEQQAPVSTTTILAIVVIVLLVIILWLLLKKKKRK